MATTFQPGRGLPAGLVHVVDLGPLPVPVRGHGDGGDSGVAGRQLQPDADDELAAADGRGRRRRMAGSRRGFYGWIERGYMRHAALGDAASRWWWRRWRSLVIASSVPLLQMVRQEYMPTNVDESGIRDERRRRPRAPAWRRWKTCCGRSYAELQDLPGVQHVVTLVGDGLSAEREQRARVCAARAMWRTACSRSRGW